MGKHRPGTPGNEDHPTNPDLFGKDKFYDPDEGGSRRALWAVFLCLTVAAVCVAIGFMFGMGHGPTDTQLRSNAVITEPGETITETAKVTLKSQLPGPTKTITKQAGPRLIPTPGPTIYRTVPAPVVTKFVQPKPNVTITKTVRATATKTVETEVRVTCIWRPRIGELECP